MTRTVVNADRVAPGLFGDFDRLDCAEVVRVGGSGGAYDTQDDESADDVNDASPWNVGVPNAATGGLAPMGLFAGSGRAAALTAQFCVVGVVQNYRSPASLWPRFGQQTPVSGPFQHYVRLLKKVMSTDISTDLGPSTISVVFSGGDIESERLRDAELVEFLAHSGTRVTYPWTPVEYAVEEFAGQEGSAARADEHLGDDDFSARVDSAELGTPSTTVLTGAVDDLRTWLSMTQRDVAELVGISAQTIMSWKREEPRFPRHGRIPVLLRLWAAVSSAREALDADAVTQLVWGGAPMSAHQTSTDGKGGHAGPPVMTAESLADLLLDAATRHVMSLSTEDDGYVPGGSSIPSPEEPARDNRDGNGDDDREAGAPRG